MVCIGHMLFAQGGPQYVRNQLLCACRQQVVMVRECVVAECGTHARFNHPGETHGVFCSKHKMEGMRCALEAPVAEPPLTTITPACSALRTL